MKLVSLLVLASACGPAMTSAPDAGDDGVDAANVDAGECRAPEMLIVLDRTGTMHRDLAGQTPPDTVVGHQSAKLTQAVTALEGLLAQPGLDTTLRLGLELFPRDPGGGACITLGQRLQGQNPTNASCEAGQLVVPPAFGTASAIASTLDAETTTICYSTPTGDALTTARTELAAIAKPGIDQYITLVTDGADFYDSCPTPDPMIVLRELDAIGIKTFIVGFGAQDATPMGVNPPLLNRMACAGHTAKNFATACMPAAGGGFDAVDPNGPRLYYDAADGAALTTALRDLTRTICCGCVL